MTLWIITTGSSDVELKIDDHWDEFYNDVENIDDFQKCNDFSAVATDEDEIEKKVLVPVRALGLVYGSHLDKFASDLRLPLLEVLTTKFIDEVKNDNNLIRVIILLTDQRKFFANKIDNEYCPFWQDTCTLEPIFRWYFQEQLKDLKVTIEFITIESDGACGIDHWNAMLKVVKDKLEEKLSELERDDRENETVYVSHQAGTPAISSAVQFVTISQFKKEVKFLVSNTFYEGYKNIRYEAEVIASSKYWRGLQIEKAKRLIISGSPGAALELVGEIVNEETREKLKKKVDEFNIKLVTNAGKNENEFEPKNAIKRVRKALDLIKVFFEQENYIQGITLLAAAHETFLKAAIIYNLQKKSSIGMINDQQSAWKPLDILLWTNEGILFLNDQKTKKNIDGEKQKDNNNKQVNKILNISLSNSQEGKLMPRLNKAKIKVLENVDFPVKYILENNDIKKKVNFKHWINQNYILYKWLCNLVKSSQTDQDQPWELLKWIGTHDRDFESDRRNQLMHNLRGVEKIDVIHYLLGCPEVEINANENRSSTNQAAQKSSKLSLEDENKSKEDAYEDYLNKTTLEVDDVVKVYKKHVRKPFLETLERFGWNDDNLNYTPLQKQLEELANSLDAEVKKTDS